MTETERLIADVREHALSAREQAAISEGKSDDDYWDPLTDDACTLIDRADLLDRVIAELARLQTENATLRKELRNGG